MNKESVEECRACLRKIDEQVSQKLFQAWCTPWAVPGALIADDLSKIADIEISEDDRYSKIICSECYNRLADACLFAINVQKADSVLRNRIQNAASTSNVTEPETSSWPKPILINKSINGDVDNRIEVEIKQEVLSEEENGSNEMDIDWEPTMDIKIEPEEIVAPVQTNFELNGYSYKDANEEAKHKNSPNICFDEEYLDNPIKQESPSGDEQEIVPDLPLDCMLCLKAFNSITGLKAHVIAQHSYGTVKRKTDDSPSPVKKEIDNELVCATCRQRFETRTDLMVHETCHGKHACFVCGAKFNSFRQLSRHGARCRPSHAPGAEGARPSRPPQHLSESRNNSSTEERTCEPIQKQVRNEPLHDEIKTEPIDRLPTIESSTEIKVEPVERQSNNGLSEEETNFKPVRKQCLNEKTKVEQVQKQETKVVNKKIISNTSRHEKKVDTVKRQANNGPLNKEAKLKTVQKQDVTKNEKVKPLKGQFNNKTTNDYTKVEQVQKESVNQPLNVKLKDKSVEGQSNNEPTNDDPPYKHVQKPNEPSKDDVIAEPSVEFNVEDQLMTPAVEAITCNSFQNRNINESLQSEVEMTESTKKNSLQSLPSNSVASLRIEDVSEKITIKIPYPNKRVPMELNFSTTQDAKRESDLEQKSELDNCLINEDEKNATKSQETVSHIGTIKEMKIHLAINPLSEEDSVLLDTKMDIEDIESVRSEGCEQKLVKVISELSDDNVTQ